jgi:ketosteroid isomerase-like protein
MCGEFSAMMTRIPSDYAQRRSITSRISFTLAALFSVVLLASAQEPVIPPLHPRIVTATRQVTLFSGLEKQLLQAVQKKDKAAIQTMLTDEFTIHLPDADPMPAEDWLQSVLSKEYVLKSFVVRQVYVADLGDAAVVTYDRVQESAYKGQSDGGEFYVTDLWKKDGDNWKLADRYVSKVGSAPVMPRGDVKPTGKG